MGRTVAAMSGGVDSSVDAALVARETGTDEVVGVWMRTHGIDPEGHELKRSCCSPDAADDARRVAQIVGIPFFVLNVEREFGERVIDDFVDQYLGGATPNPCQACFLWVLSQDQLERTRFPLGELTKSQVRAMAEELGLPTAHKPESQEICFVPLGDYRALLDERRGYAGEPGPIVDADGTRVGTHTGYAHYTVGQRHGLGVALGEAVYVREVRAATNTVVIGRRAEVAARRFSAEGRRFVAGEPPAEPLTANVPIPHPAAGAPFGG